MTTTLFQQLRRALPAWVIAVLLPAPAVITSRNGGLGLVYFFIYCIGLVADIFWRDDFNPTVEQRNDGGLWRTKLAAAAIALVAAWAVFAGMCLPLNRADFLVCSVLGLLALVPALCVTPWMLATTRNPLVAVVFTLTLVACMKLLGCVVVVLVYGWDASERGFTAMPWTTPNLLVWSFLIATGALSAIGFWQGAVRFRAPDAGHDVTLGVTQ